MADQTDKSRIIFSPPTYERHRAAFDAVAASIVNRNPKRASTRFPGVAPGAWGLLASGGTISGAVGTTLGSGEVKLCSKDGTILDDAEIDVLNAGGEITASGDTIVSLKWVAGGWAACGCAGETSFDQPFRIRGCNSLALSGATVSVWTNSGKTTLLDSGTTDSNGDVTLDVGSTGSYYHEISHTSPRFAVNSGTTTHNGTLKTINLTPATDYYCITNCLYPLYKTLYGTSAKIGSFTLTYAGGAWTGNVSWTSANCGCPSSTVSLSLTLVPVGSPLTTNLQINWNNNVNNCPDAAGGTVGFSSGFSSSACPPSFSHTANFSVTGTCTPRTLAAKGAFGIGSWSVTITE